MVPGGGRVGAFRLKGTQEGRIYIDVTGGPRGGRGVTWVKSNVATIRQAYNITVTIVAESSIPLAFVCGMKHYQPIMSMSWRHGGR